MWAERLRRRASVAVALGFVAAVVAGVQVAVSPVVALANNGDFNRVLTSVGLRATAPDRFPLPYPQLRFTSGHVTSPGAYWTSYLPALKAVTTAVTVVTGGTFDLRVLGVLFSTALGVLVFAICKRFVHPAAQVAVGVVLVLGLCDGRPVAYFDSFYDEPWSLLVLGCVVVAVLANGGRRVLSPRGFLVWSLLGVVLVTAKTQDALLALPVIVATLPLSLRSRSGGPRLGRKVLPVICSLVVGTGAVAYLLIQPAVYSHDSLYDQVFVDLLVYSPHPRADLAWLGLPPNMIAYADTNAYEAQTGFDTPEFQHFAAHGGQGRVLMFYLAHPSEAVSALLRGVRDGTQAHLNYLGYRTASSPAKAGADGCGLCLYSRTLADTTPASPFPLLLLYAAALIGAILLRRRQGANGLSDAVIFLLAVSALSLITAAFGEGRYEEVKHLYLFYVADIIILALAAGSYIELLRPRPATPSTEAAQREPLDDTDAKVSPTIADASC
jgi:hypothetical protein